MKLKVLFIEPVTGYTPRFESGQADSQVHAPGRLNHQVAFCCHLQDGDSAWNSRQVGGGLWSQKVAYEGP